MLRERKLWEVLTVDGDGVQNAAIRVISSEALFNTSLSAHVGVIRTSCLDVHTIDDIRAIERGYGDAAALTAHKRS